MSQASPDSSAAREHRPKAPNHPKPVVLIVRDGWGRNPHPEHNAFNAILQAETPRCDALLREYPWTLIKTSGEDVGLPEGTMGNSEVGHQNLGAGRIVDQESVRITKAIRDGSFFDNHVLVQAVQKARDRDAAVHLFCIASDAGVHGLLDHLYGTLELCRRQGAEAVFVHLFTDGRDTGPFTGAEYVRQVEERCADLGVGRVATVCGRYWAMDRDNRWERVQRAYDCLTGRSTGEDEVAVPRFDSAPAAVQDYYDHPTGGSQQGDEFITPRTVGADSAAVAASRVSDGDTVIFVNYRGDRPRELSQAFVFEDFYGHVKASPDSGERGFDRGPRLDLTYVTMTAYQEELGPFVEVAFPKPPKLEDIGGAYLSRLGLRQFRCAETEKFPHVTFFFNDYRDEPFPGESRSMAQSPRVATYDLKPEMSAQEVCDAVLERIVAEDCEDFILVNFANTDMVGHTGKLPAAIRAAEVVDEMVGAIVDATVEHGGKLIVTADHGNSEQMWDPETEAPHTAHTTYDVELIVVDPHRRDQATGSPEKPSPGLREGGRLADVFPTILELMQLEQPSAMAGCSLLKG
ncbi:MAG: 2,3-bisphosphoglycerate-independent phosphoglycerate mutase [Acidobacteriota bacterium]|nr:2,3-bisphosphoglycerate-independent phosphoglycerate mutase [Acidobacteriota bacterium]